MKCSELEAQVIPRLKKINGLFFLIIFLSMLYLQKSLHVIDTYVCRLSIFIILFWIISSKEPPGELEGNFYTYNNFDFYCTVYSIVFNSCVNFYSKSSIEISLVYI